MTERKSDVLDVCSRVVSFRISCESLDIPIEPDYAHMIPANKSKTDSKDFTADASGENTETASGECDS